MILPQGGASYLGILLSLGWSRLFEAGYYNCVPVKTPWDDECQNKSCYKFSEKAIILSQCIFDSKTGKNLSGIDIYSVTFPNLTSPTKGMFEGLSLEILTISSDQVKEFEVGCFENLTVTTMRLEWMNLDTLPQEFFRGLQANRLDIAHSTLTNPRAGIFIDVKRINILNFIAIDNLTYLPKDFFKGLHMLQSLYIDISYEIGVCFSKTIFQPLTSVTGMEIFPKTLGMTYCPKMFKGFTNATWLYAPKTEMSSFVKECNSDMNIMGVKQVEDLNLWKNCGRNDGCYDCEGSPHWNMNMEFVKQVKDPLEKNCECNGSAPLGLKGSGSAVRGRIEDAAVGFVGALSLVAILTSAGN